MVSEKARGIGVKYLFLIPCLLVVTVVSAQSNAHADRNKFALIINGAGGEAAYAKQFEEWTTQLQSALSNHYGFGAEQTKVLPRATAEDVKRTFAQLKTQLDANNVLFVFLI